MQEVQGVMALVAIALSSRVTEAIRLNRVMEDILRREDTTHRHSNSRLLHDVMVGWEPLVQRRWVSVVDCWAVC